MKVYILTNEPYHDNSWIIGVYMTEEEGLGALSHEMVTDDFNADDMRLTEWNLENNTELRVWNKYGEQQREGGQPVRKVFTLSGPT